MRTTRIYHPENLTENAITILNDQASNHLLRVLRLKPGAKIQIFNGAGGEYSTELIGVEKKHALIKVHQFSAITKESPLTIHLGQSISRGEKMDYTIQKSVELGVSKITPLITEFGNVKLSPERFAKKLEHWRGIIISACEQCGRNYLPEITSPQLLSTWLAERNETLKLILEPQAESRLQDIGETPLAVCLLIGAEGGLSEDEIGLAKSYHFTAIQLGPRILRTETAAVAAIAILQARWGDMLGCQI